MRRPEYTHNMFSFLLMFMLSLMYNVSHICKAHWYTEMRLI